MASYCNRRVVKLSPRKLDAVIKLLNAFFSFGASIIDLVKFVLLVGKSGGASARHHFLFARKLIVEEEKKTDGLKKIGFTQKVAFDALENRPSPLLGTEVYWSCAESGTNTKNDTAKNAIRVLMVNKFMKVKNRPAT